MNLLNRPGGPDVATPADLGAARRHRIGKASARWVMADTQPVATIISGHSPAWIWVGADERGRELEVIAVETQGDNDPDPILLVIHVMPTAPGGGRR